MTTIERNIDRMETAMRQGDAELNGRALYRAVGRGDAKRVKSVLQEIEGGWGINREIFKWAWRLAKEEKNKEILGLLEPYRDMKRTKYNSSKPDPVGYWH